MSYLAEENPIFQPAVRLVDDVTKADPALITTSFDHDYIIGTTVRFYIPDTYGMYQLNHLVGEILTIPTTDTFTVSIDTRDFNTFSVPGSPKQYAQVVPIGENTFQTYAAFRNTLDS